MLANCHVVIRAPSIVRSRTTSGSRMLQGRWYDEAAACCEGPLAAAAATRVLEARPGRSRAEPPMSQRRATRVRFSRTKDQGPRTKARAGEKLAGRSDSGVRSGDGEDADRGATPRHQDSVRIAVPGCLYAMGSGDHGPHPGPNAVIQGQGDAPGGAALGHVRPVEDRDTDARGAP